MHSLKGSVCRVKVPVRCMCVRASRAFGLAKTSGLYAGEGGLVGKRTCMSMFKRDVH